MLLNTEVECHVPESKKPCTLMDLPIPIARLDQSLAFVSASRVFCDWLGVSDAQLPGSAISRLFDGALPEGVVQHFHSAQCHAPFTVRHAINTANGRRWTEITLTPCTEPTASGDLYLTVKDIHEHYQAELLHQGDKGQLAFLTNGMFPPICSIDREQRYTYANDQCLQFMGCTFGEIEGRTIKETLSPADYQFVQPYVERALAGEAVSYERLISFQNGVQRWMYINYVAIRDEHNEICGAWAVFTDVDRLKHAEHDLRQTYRILAAHVENTPLAVIEWDGNMRTQRWSSQAERLFHWQPEDVLGKHPDEFSFVFEADREMVSSAITRLMTGSEPRNSCIVRHYTREGAVIYCEWHSSAVFDDNGRLLSILTMLHDISERMQSEISLRHLATHDPLTGLFNRAAFGEHLERSLARARREKSKLFLLFIDLDRFKFVNDTLGHHMGDELLKQVVARLRGGLREVDTLSRLGGDEFTVVLENVSDVECISMMAQRLLNTLSHPFTLGANTATISASIGISTFPDNGTTANELINNADAAMFRAKGLGRSTYRFFTPQAALPAHDDLQLDDEMRKGIDGNQFYLEYLPKISLLTGKVTGVEALLRWRHPTLGDMAPSSFISVAEKTGLIIPLGEWVLKTACLQQVKWRSAGLQPIEMAVNISPLQICQARFVQAIDEIFSGFKAQGHDCDLEIEITESCLMSHKGETLNQLKELKRRNIKIAVDDFGTGYSSLSHLVRLPVDTLKIDRSFVSNLQSSENAASVVIAIIQLAHSMNLHVIAEGVENRVQQDFLTRHGCDDCQGFLLSQPATPAQIASLLYQQRSHPQVQRTSRFSLNHPVFSAPSFMEE